MPDDTQVAWTRNAYNNNYFVGQKTSEVVLCVQAKCVVDSTTALLCLDLIYRRFTQ